MADVLDRTKGDLASLYAVKATTPVMVSVPRLDVISIDGEGDPNTSLVYTEAVQALMQIAWGTRMARKATGGQLFKVMPLEGIWTLPEGVHFQHTADVMKQLIWSMQIVMPTDVTTAEIEAVRSAAQKRHPHLASLERVVLTSIPPHDACTLLHIGPYADEPATMARIRAAIADIGRCGELWHREIYLSDPRRSAPEKLKTILRVTLTTP